MSRYEYVDRILEDTAKSLVNLKLIEDTDYEHIRSTDRYVLDLYENVPVEQVPPFHGPMQLLRLRTNMMRFIELGIASGNPKLTREVHETDWRQVCDLIDLHDLSLYNQWGTPNYQTSYSTHAEDSAALAISYLQDRDLPKDYIESVRDGVLSTHITFPETTTHKVFCDLDISGLVGSYDECLDGCKDIQREFGIDEGTGIEVTAKIYYQLFSRTPENAVLYQNNGNRSFRLFTGLGKYFSEHHEKAKSGGLYSNGMYFIKKT